MRNLEVLIRRVQIQVLQSRNQIRQAPRKVKAKIGGVEKRGGKQEGDRFVYFLHLLLLDVYYNLLFNCFFDEILPL